MEQKYGKTFIREWRKRRGLSLRRLADRLEIDGPAESYSHASIGRIEKGQQPYSQPVIEAIADALDVSVTDLLTVDPSKAGEVVDLLRLLNDAAPSVKNDILEYAAFKLQKTGTSD